MTSEQMNDRLQRDRNAQAKARGFADVAAMDAALEAGKAAATAAETARREQLTKEAKLEEDLAAANTKATEAQEAADYSAFQAHVGRIAVDLNVKNLEYAEHLVAKAAEALPEGQELDVKVFLTGLVAEGSVHQAALGVAPPVETVTPPVVTAPGNPNVAPPAPAPPGGTGTGAKKASQMTDKEWAAHKATLGIM